MPPGLSHRASPRLYFGPSLNRIFLCVFGTDRFPIQFGGTEAVSRDNAVACTVGRAGVGQGHSTVEAG